MKPMTCLCLSSLLWVLPGCENAAQTILGYEKPSWTAVVHMSDGRTFVTDEHIALDVEWAKPETLPTGTFPAEGIEWAIERQRRSGAFDAFSVNSVTDVGVDGAYRGEGGILLDPRYIDYLRWEFLWQDVQLHARDNNTDVVISIDGDYVGALAPMKLER